jgi:hypothetical protein
MTKRAGLTLAELTRAAKIALAQRVKITIAPDKTVTIEPVPERQQNGVNLAPKRKIVL